jgi:MerR family transcriptional regulator/heat shock protein HspR
MSAVRSGQSGGDPMGRAVYVISVAAELAGVHPQTLRVYERRGLVDPLRTGGGSRRYSDRDLERLRRIQDLTAEGLNLEGVRKVLVLEAEVERLRSELERVRSEARETVEQTHRQYRRDLVPLRQLPVPGFRAGSRQSGRAGSGGARR